MEEVLDAYHRGGATTTMGDGTTMSREDVLELVIAKSEAEDPETEFYFVPRDVVLAFQAAPPSSSAVEENGGQHASLPRFQTLLEQEQLVKKKVSLRGAVRGDYRGAFAAASHRWEDPAIPDHSGEQIARVQQYLRSHPSVEYFWFDFWSMPQCAFDDSRDASTGELVHFGCKRDDRTPEEKDEFGTMLRRVNSLYLGMEVLLIMDLSYVSRFWTQFEAWLAMQQTTDAGLSSAVGVSGGAQRYEVMGVLNARDMSEQQLEMIEKMWGTATPEEAHAKLSHKDVTVTNQGDKEFQLKKIKTLQLSVRLARAAVAAERELASLLEVQAQAEQLKRQQVVLEQQLVADHANRLAANEARRQELIAEQQAAIANTEYAVAERIKSDLGRLDDERAEMEAREAERLQATAAVAANGAGIVEEGVSLAIVQCKATLAALVERQKAAKEVPREQLDVRLLKQLKGEIDQAKQDLAAAEQRAADEEARKAAEDAAKIAEDKARQEAAAVAAAAEKARKKEDQIEFEARKRQLEAGIDQAMEADDFDALEDLQQQLRDFTFAAFVEQKRGDGN